MKNEYTTGLQAKILELKKEISDLNKANARKQEKIQELIRLRLEDLIIISQLRSQQEAVRNRLEENNKLIEQTIERLKKVK